MNLKPNWFALERYMPRATWFAILSRQRSRHLCQPAAAKALCGASELKTSLSSSRRAPKRGTQQNAPASVVEANILPLFNSIFDWFGTGLESEDSDNVIAIVSVMVAVCNFHTQQQQSIVPESLESRVVRTSSAKQSGLVITPRHVSGNKDWSASDTLNDVASSALVQRDKGAKPKTIHLLHGCTVLELCRFVSKIVEQLHLYLYLHCICISEMAWFWVCLIGEEKKCPHSKNETIKKKFRWPTICFGLAIKRRLLYHRSIRFVTWNASTHHLSKSGENLKVIASVIATTLRLPNVKSKRLRMCDQHVDNERFEKAHASLARRQFAQFGRLSEARCWWWWRLHTVGARCCRQRHK